MTKTLALLEALIKKPSITPNDEGCQDLIAQRLTPLGFVDERLDFDDTQNIWLRRGQSAPLFVFLGHTDVVPVAGQPWDTDPFQMIKKGSRYYGRGTCDMKAFPATALALLPEMLARPLVRPIHFALSYDEEVGCLGAPEWPVDTAGTAGSRES